MKFKHVLIIFFIFAAAACKSHTDYTTADNFFTLTVPAQFKKTTDGIQAGLLCVSKDETIKMAFFSHRTEDLAKTADSDTLLEIYAGDLTAKKEITGKAENEEYYTTEDKYIRRLLYPGTGENNARYYYILSSVDFYNNQDVILVAVQSVPVKQYSLYSDILRKVIESAKAN